MPDRSARSPPAASSSDAPPNRPPRCRPPRHASAFVAPGSPRALHFTQPPGPTPVKTRGRPSCVHGGPLRARAFARAAAGDTRRAPERSICGASPAGQCFDRGLCGSHTFSQAADLCRTTSAETPPPAS